MDEKIPSDSGFDNNNHSDDDIENKVRVQGRIKNCLVLESDGHDDMGEVRVGLVVEKAGGERLV